MVNNPTWGEVLGEAIGNIGGSMLAGKAIRDYRIGEEKRAEKREISRGKRNALLKMIENSDVFNPNLKRTNHIKDRQALINYVYSTPGVVSGANKQGEEVFMDQATGKAFPDVILKPRTTEANRISREKFEYQKQQDTQAATVKQQETERKIQQTERKTQESERETKIKAISDAMDYHRQGVIALNEQQVKQLVIYRHILGTERWREVTDDMIANMFQEPEKKNAFSQALKAGWQGVSGFFNMLRGQSGGGGGTAQQPSPTMPTPAQRQASGSKIERIMQRIQENRAKGISDEIIAAELKKAKLDPTLFGLNVR